VDHRSLAAQREYAIQKDNSQKAVELDRAPQVKLGWKVVQMERRGLLSDRGSQLRQVQAENLQRQNEVLDIGRLREQLAQHQRQEGERQAAERQKALSRVEVFFHGKSRGHQETILHQWHVTATQDIPRVENARAIWEKDPWDQDAKAWREARNSIDREVQEVNKVVQAIKDWYRAHPWQSLGLRLGVMKTPVELGRLEQEYTQNVRFLKGGHQTLERLEQTWEQKRSAYEQHLEWKAASIQETRESLRVIAENPEHFRKFWDQEDRAVQQERQRRERERSLERDRGHDGWERSR
jgi:hypothetical protein